jgi:hypothetical protein
MDPQQDQYR